MERDVRKGKHRERAVSRSITKRCAAVGPERGEQMQTRGDGSGIEIGVWFMVMMMRWERRRRRITRKWAHKEEEEDNKEMGTHTSTGSTEDVNWSRSMMTANLL